MEELAGLKVAWLTRSHSGLWPLRSVVGQRKLLGKELVVSAGTFVVMMTVKVFNWWSCAVCGSACSDVVELKRRPCSW